jgi:hypothetical protein
LLLKPSGLAYGAMKVDDMVVVDFEEISLRTSCDPVPIRPLTAGSLSPGVVLDFNPAISQVVGVEILNLSKRFGKMSKRWLCLADELTTACKSD